MTTAASTPAEKRTPPTPEESEKILAEVEKIRAETTKTLREVQTAEDEERRKQEKHEADMTLVRATIEGQQYNAEVARIVTQREQRVELIELAKDRYHYVYPFNAMVSETSVRSCVERITEWVRNAGDAKLNIEIVFDSPGGSVLDGMHLYDYIQSVRYQGHKITTLAFGMAASMAGILLQAGDVRAIGRESYLLVHEVSFGVGGKIGEVIDEVKFVEKIQGRVLDIFADRAASALIARGDHKEAEYDKVRAERRRFFAKSWKRTDWWLSSNEALACGLVDEVR